MASISLPHPVAKFNTNENASFLNDVLEGLTAKEKYLNSKYFYDEAGDELFQRIMASPQYYLTRSEMEIFTEQTTEIASAITAQHEEFDLIELGAGDATKSIYLLTELLSNNINFTYYPVDISKNVIDLLYNLLPKKLPSLKLHGLNGEYFEMLEKASNLSDKKKVVLFLGGNIGNVSVENVRAFCKRLNSFLKPNDLVLIGFDLKKDPQLILDAYNDKEGLTREFNLNLLRRINRELHANFNISNFKHYPTYDPTTGTCKSYLVSNIKQDVEIKGHSISFAAGETIHTEISQKYTVEQIERLAASANFIPIKSFYDSNQWFVDCVWKVQ